MRKDLFIQLSIRASGRLAVPTYGFGQNPAEAINIDKLVGQDLYHRRNDDQSVIRSCEAGVVAIDYGYPDHRLTISSSNCEYD